MGYVIMAIVAAVVAAVIVIVLLALRRQKVKADRTSRRNREFGERRERAPWATAVVAHVTAGNAGEYATRSWVSLTLEVTPAGGEPYRAKTTWLVENTAAGSLNEGQTIQVRIDADDPKIIYPGSPWAEYVVRE